jgi:hypothetical protein
MEKEERYMKRGIFIVRILTMYNRNLTYHYNLILTALIQG